MASLAGAGQLQLIPARAYLFRQGDPAEALYVLRRGLVQLTLEMRPVRRIAVGLLSREGDLLWLAPLFTPGPRFVSALALTEVELLAVPKANAAAAVRRFPGLASSLALAVEDQLRGVLGWAERQEFRDVHYRAAWACLTFGQRAGTVDEDGVIRLDRGVAQADLAALAGLSREAFNRALKGLAENGAVVSTHNGIILDVARLEAYLGAGHPPRRRGRRRREGPEVAAG